MTAKAKSFLMDYIPILLLTPAIVVSGAAAGQAAYKILPAVATLFVVLLSSKLYRVAFLLGAANCVLYSVGYFVDGLYGSVVSCLVISAPLQVLSWFLWRRNAYKQATIFRRMKPWLYPFVAMAAAALTFGMLYVSNRAGGANGMIALDCALFALGLVVSVLLTFAFVEGFVLNLLSCALTVIMWAILAARNIRDVTYLLVSLYNVFRVSLALAACVKMYRVQQLERKEGADA